MARFSLVLAMAFSASLLTGVAPVDAADNPRVRRLPLKQYRDKMKGGWLGQVAGVGWGQPTEFQWKAAVIPADKMPPWNTKMINQHGNDIDYQSGGRIEKDAAGEEVFVIPVQDPSPGRLEQCWDPGPAAESRVTPQEMAKIKPRGKK
jgi:hypothetical protein